MEFLNRSAIEPDEIIFCSFLAVCFTPSISARISLCRFNESEREDIFLSLLLITVPIITIVHTRAMTIQIRTRITLNPICYSFFVLPELPSTPVAILFPSSPPIIQPMTTIAEVINEAIAVVTSDSFFTIRATTVRIERHIEHRTYL